MRVRVVAGVTCAVLVLVGGCTTGPEGGKPGATTGSTAERWTMPDLVGSSLQDAQDHIQDLTSGSVYFTVSHDVSGRDRSQAIDANWQVCSQNVAPGDTLTISTRLDFGVVKHDETCP